ncbi:hypothetical protein [Sphingomicrobium lutaoense]|uniref:Sporulation stage II protein D amidase enhancer LytB N-terminal domain-containing protein n=1 Tax=Sphingomicrobium lutaoense TaxID=515949 RepID=A0A839Z0Z6_9SPHN|nr:hypothetical protein [Sphingomicrobium lutaoense]MBB3764228.1 hypothetical protein [Sphingomicrobium lutaoense]
MGDKIRFGWLAAVALLLMLFPCEARASVTPLFTDSAPLEVTIEGPILKLYNRARTAGQRHPALLRTAGESHRIILSARGLSRRNEAACEFPPLRVTFVQKPEPGSLFHRQSSIKLVTHCQDSGHFEQLLLKEYAAYRLYNVLTDRSLKVRLARIRYMDGGRERAHRYGFFIEDIDDAAKRLGGVEIDRGSVSPNAVSRPDGARYMLFQYMIGNVDWSIYTGPSGRSCCHNSKLVGPTKTSGADLIPIPYDFDGTGWVAPPYSEPPEGLRLGDIRQRRYRGFCAYNELVREQVGDFLRARPALEAELASIPGVDQRTLRRMMSYLDGFYDDLSGRGLERNMLKDCRP